MPEFEVLFNKDLIGVCRDLGIRLAFTDNADFSKMSTANLEIAEILHRARIKVDREGTEAAAVTIANSGLGCAFLEVNKPKKVILNRPFIYAVMHNRTRLPIFIGAVREL